MLAVLVMLPCAVALAQEAPAAPAEGSAAPGLVRAAEGSAAPVTEWSPVVELRGRVEASLEDARGAAEVGQRAVVGLQVDRLALAARVTLADTRVWNTDGDGVVEPERAATGVAEAWARVRWAFDRNVGIRATFGRQSLEVHEGRIVGDDDRALEPQLFEAARVELDALPFSLELANARRFIDGDARGFGVTIVRAGLAREQDVTRWVADGLWVVDARRTEEVTSTQGVYARFDSGRWLSRGELYLQAHEDGTASLFGAELGHVFGAHERAALIARYDGTSGDPGGSAGSAAWRPVLGDSQRFRGYLDPFEADVRLPAQGLGDASIVLRVQAGARFSAELTGHAFVPLETTGLHGVGADLALDWSFSPFGTVRGLAGALHAPGADLAARARAELHVAF